MGLTWRPVRRRYALGLGLGCACTSYCCTACGVVVVLPCCWYVCYVCSFAASKLLSTIAFLAAALSSCFFFFHVLCMCGLICTTDCPPEHSTVPSHVWVGYEPIITALIPITLRVSHHSHPTSCARRGVVRQTGRTPLLAACANAHVDAAALLLKWGADTDAQDSVSSHYFSATSCFFLGC